MANKKTLFAFAGVTIALFPILYHPLAQAPNRLSPGRVLQVRAENGGRSGTQTRVQAPVVSWWFIFAQKITGNVNTVAAFSPSYPTLAECQAMRTDCVTNGCRATACLHN